MFLANLLLIASSIFMLLLAILVYIGNPKRIINRVLSVFILSLLLWLVTNLLTNLSPTAYTAQIFAQLTYIGPLLAATFFLLFVLLFSSPYTFKKNTLIKLLIPLFIFMPFTLTEYNIQSIERYGANAKTGILYIPLIAVIAVYACVGLVTLFYQYRHSKSNTKKLQIKYVLFGILSVFIPGLFINGIAPIFGMTSLVVFGPNVVVLMAVFMTIALLKYELLETRAIIAKAVAYLLLIATTGVFYAFVTEFMFETIFRNSVPSSIIRILTIVVLVFTIEPLKRILTSLTTKIFHQDTYVPQNFLSEINKILVTEVEIKNLLEKSAHIINENLRSQFSSFLINKTESFQDRYIGGGVSEISKDEAEKLQTLLKEMSQKIVVTFGSEDTSVPSDIKLKNYLKKFKIDIVIRLRGEVDNKKADLGYLIVGVKRTGSVYASQDIKILEIIANELVIAIENALRLEEIKQFNVTLQEEIDDATKQLRHTNEKLKALDETKDEFISMASHQLRTPLTSVKGYLSMVLEGDAGKLNEQQQKLLSQAFTSSQRMVYLIADLLNVSRLKTGKFVIEAVPTYLPDVVEGEISQLKETAAAKGLTLNYEKPQDFPKINLDETKTRQVIMNFADNAIYYTPAGGTITVALNSTPQSVEFTVTDTGLGVPKKEQHHLFGKFYRAENAKKARPDGTGLGLFMAKKVIIAQGGAIIFRSQEGKGSTFGFTFPRARLEAHGEPTKA